MNRKLFWKLCLSICLGAILLVYLTSQLSLKIESQQSLIADKHKQQLLTWRDQVQQLLDTEPSAVESWLQQLYQREGIYASVIYHRSEAIFKATSAGEHPDMADPRFGRHIDWPIHLYHANPLINLPLQQTNTSLVVELPQRMRPGQWWPHMHFLLHTLVPLAMMALVSLLLYRHLMQPLQKLECATERFAAGDYAIRLLPSLGRRNDELTKLAASFDAMADRVGQLIQTQRHLINDLSHELRTPLQRLKLAISSAHPERESRLIRETERIQQLAEDTLTLARLDNDTEAQQLEVIVLTSLLEPLLEDAHFEFPEHSIKLSIADIETTLVVNLRGFTQAFENVLRNALRYSPKGSQIEILLLEQDDLLDLAIRDQGPGVAEMDLEKIFEPFFRTDSSRQQGGFGLGLALAKRHLGAMGAQLSARNTHPGLEVIISGLRRQL